MTKYEQLITEASELELKAKECREAAEQISIQCRHEWEKTEYKPIIHKAFTMPFWDYLFWYVHWSTPINAHCSNGIKN